MSVPQSRWRRTLTAIDPLSRAASQPGRSRDRARPSPGATAADSRLRSVPWRRALHWAATATAAFLVAFAAVTVMIAGAAALLYGLILLVGWQFLAGVSVGAAIVVAVSEFTGWNRHRKLRELLDWLGEDNQARKIADLRNDQRIRFMRGELP